MNKNSKYIKGFLGAAGTGKTFQIFEEIKRIEEKKNFKDHESILALSFMHGARKRLQEKLNDADKISFSYECKTIDSFALYIVNNFRIYLKKELHGIPVLPSYKISGEYRFDESNNKIFASINQIRKWACEILGNKIVKESISNAYPIIIIDEFQDCNQYLLLIVKELASSSKLIVAADEFQYLNTSDECEAVAWIRNQGTVKELKKNYRTKNEQLLNTALALRENKKKANCIHIEGVNGGGLVAWKIFERLKFDGWRSKGKSVLLTPVKPQNSKFLKQILKSTKKELGKKVNIGPYPFTWDNEKNEIEKDIYDAIPTEILEKDKVTLVDLEKIKDRDQNEILKKIITRARKLCKIRGEQEIFTAEFLNIIGKKIHTYFSYQYGQYQNYRAMTIHSAKNQEFENVFIVWPYEVPSDFNYQRKLMYNAVTRAKINAAIFVQGGEDRFKKDPLLQLITAPIHS